MRNQTFYYIFALTVILYSCNSSRNEIRQDVIVSIEAPKISNEMIDKCKFFVSNHKHINQIYDATNYKSVWFDKNRELTPRAQELIKLLKASNEYGILNNQFRTDKIDSMLAEKDVSSDVLLSDGYLKFFTQYAKGAFNVKDSIYFVNKIDSLDLDLTQTMLQNNDKSDFSIELNTFKPKHFEYEVLENGMKKFMRNYKGDGERIRVPKFKDDTAKCFRAVQEALVKNLFFDTSYFQNHDSLVSALKQFQVLHGLEPDGRPGRNTRTALGMSNQDRFLQGVLALEKWRSKKAYPDNYIRVNIPTYKLQVWKKDSLQVVHRVVTGAKTINTQTPEFTAEMKTIVAYPFWHVPFSISSKELYYKAKKDSSYLRRNGYKLFKDGNQVNSGTVDWSKIAPNQFPYRVRQNGGRGNSLGLVKFLFPNKHSVYFHDTPSKRLFKNDVRAYSHGCVRVNAPIELARFLLKKDNNTIQGDTLDSLIARRQQRHIKLKNPFNVYLEYITAVGDSSNNLVLHIDVYGRDKKFIEFVRKSNENLEN